MTRANFDRIATRHTTAFRHIAIAVRDWSRAIKTEPVPFPTVLAIGIPYFKSPADVHWYAQILDNALTNAGKKLENQPGFETVRANIEAAGDSAGGAFQIPH